MKCFVDLITIAIFLVLFVPSQSFALFGQGTNRANVGTDWTDTDKSLSTTGDITADEIEATTGVKYNQGDTNAADRYMRAKFQEALVTDTDFDSLTLAISDIGPVNATRLRLCQDNVLANGETLIVTVNIILDTTCGGTISGISGGGIETLTVSGGLIGDPNHQWVGDDLVLSDFAKVEKFHVGWFANIETAVTLIGAIEKILVVSKTETITDGVTVTIPSTMTHQFVRGGLIQGVAGGGTETLTYADGSAIIADKVYQIIGDNLTVAVGSGIGKLYPEWRGAVGDGATDDTAAFSDIFTWGAGKEIVLKKDRTYTLASASLAALTNDAISVLAGTKITGNGAVLQVTGSAVCGILDIRDVSSVHIRDLEFIGNNVSQASVSLNQGTAIVFTNTGASDISDFLVEDCIFSDFKAAGWVWFNVSSTGAISDGRVINCDFSGGDTQDPTDAGAGASPIFFGSSGSGGLNNMYATGNIIDATDLKGGIAMIANTGTIDRAHITGNTIKDAGLTDVATTVNSYAILAKPNVHNSIFSNNIIDGAVHGGIYLVSNAVGNVVEGNRIKDVTATDDTTLLRGAICIRGPDNIINGNTITDSAFGIQFQPDPATAVTNVTISNNIVTGATENALKLRPGPAVVGTGLTVSNNQFESSGHAVLIFTTASATDRIDHVMFTGNRIYSSAATGFVIGGSATGYSHFKLSNNFIKGDTYGIYLNALLLDDWDIDNNTIVGTGNTTTGLYVTNADTAGARMVNVRNNLVYDVSAGDGYLLNSVSGSVYGNQAINCSATVGVLGGVNNLGTDTPWFTSALNDGMRVQKFTVAVDGNGRIQDGWIWDGAAWRTTWVSAATW